LEEGEANSGCDVLHCRTTLIKSFRARFPHELKYEGNRAIVFDEDEDIPVQALEFCIAASFTYHRREKSKGKAAGA